MMVRKNSSKQDALSVYKFFEQNKKFGKIYTVNYFIAEQVLRITFYSILLPASGVTYQKKAQKKLNELKNYLNHKATMSQRQSVRKFNTSQLMLCKILKRTK